jgi:hypothetical protein
MREQVQVCIHFATSGMYRFELQVAEKNSAPKGKACPFSRVISNSGMQMLGVAVRCACGALSSHRQLFDEY